jgi:hypothetical protein
METNIENSRQQLCLRLRGLQVDDWAATPAVRCSLEDVADGGTYIFALRRISATTQCLCLLKGLEGSSLT